jgi:hypothetical protein
MTGNNRCVYGLLLVLAVGGVWLTSTPVLAETASLKTTPSGLTIRESFQGAAVTVSALIPKGTSAVVEIKGHAHDDSLLRKGRRGGLWMSVGEVKVAGAPSLYLLMSTAPDLLSRKDTESRWGYEALHEQMKFSGAMPKEGESLLFAQFVKLKESEGLYGVFPGSLKIGDGTGDVATVEGTMMMPSNVAPGSYTVSLSVIKDGKTIDRKSVEFPVEIKGLPALLASLAQTNATLYGLLAVTIAILTGFVMGYVFKGKAAH